MVLPKGSVLADRNNSYWIGGRSVGHSWWELATGRYRPKAAVQTYCRYGCSESTKKSRYEEGSLLQLLPPPNTAGLKSTRNNKWRRSGG